MLQYLHRERPRPVRNQICALLALGLAMMTACGDSARLPTGVTTANQVVRDPTAFFQADMLSYQLRAGPIGYEVEIGVSYTNLSPATAYLTNCNGLTALSLERFEGDGWVTAWTPVIPTCASPPIVVQPFETARMNVAVFGGYPDCVCSPKFTAADPTGVYRLVWSQVYNSYNSTTQAYTSLMPLQMRVSSPFYVAAQAR